MNVKLILICIFIGTFIILPFGIYAQPPTPPHLFQGAAFINNEPAVNGTIISAVINGIEVANTTIENGAYSLMVHGVPDDLVSFYINDIQTDQTALWDMGGISQLNLTVYADDVAIIDDAEIANNEIPKTPGFGVAFTIIGLFSAAYLLSKSKNA
jgi:PGF-CTERM protein